MDGDETLAVMPLYIKEHSWGEYVFDWSWAQAVEQAGGQYYPKLVTASPMTPCVGPRLLWAREQKPEVMVAQALKAVQERAEQIDASSWHLLFPMPSEARLFELAGCSLRTGVQFHWFNANWKDFGDMTEAFTARQRKNIRRERKRSSPQAVEWREVPGTQMSEEVSETLYHFYQLTHIKRMRQGYLTREFFHALPKALGDRWLAQLCLLDGKPMAGATLFRAPASQGFSCESASPVGQLCSGETEANSNEANEASWKGGSLYGRHWGCYREYRDMHFETCYYRGQDMCLRDGMARFDAGAQGQHKLRRGFIPIPTYSAHWLRDERLASAVADFCEKEAQELESYHRACQEHTPYASHSRDKADFRLLEPHQRRWAAWV